MKEFLKYKVSTTVLSKGINSKDVCLISKNDELIIDIISCIKDCIGKKDYTPLIDKYGIDPKDLLLYGKLEKLTSKKFYGIVDKVLIKDIDDNNVYSYKCFAGCNWEKPNKTLILHEDAGSSLNCLKEQIGDKYKYAIILKL